MWLYLVMRSLRKSVGYMRSWGWALIQLVCLLIRRGTREQTLSLAGGRALRKDFVRVEWEGGPWSWASSLQKKNPFLLFSQSMILYYSSPRRLGHPIFKVNTYSTSNGEPFKDFKKGSIIKSTWLHVENSYELLWRSGHEKIQMYLKMLSGRIFLSIP